MNQNICLCYNSKKGLYTKYCYNCDEAIFTTYTSIGFKTIPIDLPNEKFKIWIHSNFKYGNNSFLYAVITHDDIPLLDFSIEKITILRHSSVRRFSVASEDWESLLNKIIVACKCYTQDIVVASAISYVDELCSVLNSDSVEIKATFHDTVPKIWKGKSLMTILVAIKLQDLLECLAAANIEDKILSEHIVSTCQLFLHNLSMLSLDSNDSRLPSFAATLKCICNYLSEHGLEVEFLRYFMHMK